MSFAERLGAARRIPHPFPRIEFQPFEPFFYRMLLEQLPVDEAYAPLPHEDFMAPNGEVTRRVIHDERFHEIGGPWETLAVELKSPGVAAAAEFALGVELANAVPRVLLVRDLPGFKIRPHVDTVAKVATIQCYLPRDFSQLECGTTLYKDDCHAGAVPFAPNHAWGFVRSENSWHGVIETPMAWGARNSLMLIYYRKGKS